MSIALKPSSVTTQSAAVIFAFAFIIFTISDRTDVRADEMTGNSTDTSGNVTSDVSSSENSTIATAMIATSSNKSSSSPPPPKNGKERQFALTPPANGKYPYPRHHHHHHQPPHPPQHHHNYRHGPHTYSPQYHSQPYSRGAMNQNTHHSYHHPYSHAQQYPHHHHHLHHHPRSHSQHYRSSAFNIGQLEPAHVAHFANASKLIVGELVSGMSQALQNFITAATSRHFDVGRAGVVGGVPLNGGSIIATASALLPSSSKLFSQMPILSNTHIAMASSAPSPITANVTNGNETLIRDGATKVDNDYSAATTYDDVDGDGGKRAPLNAPVDSINYELEGQRLRQDIVQKVGHLQTVLTTALEVSKERRDIITRRILEQTNLRLEQAKERADRILSEPLNSQIAVRALYAINQGINSINSFLQSLSQRINVSIINGNLANMSQQTPKTAATDVAGNVNAPTTSAKPSDQTANSGKDAAESGQSPNVIKDKQ